MSVTRTYRLASSAQKKLGKEVERSDWILRRLVGHANLLDTVLEELHQGKGFESESSLLPPVAKHPVADSLRKPTILDSAKLPKVQIVDDDSNDDSDEDEDDCTDNEDEENDFEHTLSRVVSQCLATATTNLPGTIRQDGNKATYLLEEESRVTACLPVDCNNLVVRIAASSPEAGISQRANSSSRAATLANILPPAREEQKPLVAPNPGLVAAPA